MDWKEKTLESIRKNALVEPVSCHENKYVVSMERDGEMLRTVITLDVENKSVSYENNARHALDTAEALLDSMNEHLTAVEIA